MKKILLLISAVACLSTIQAQNVWQDEFDLPREVAIAANKDVTAATPTGEVYVSGVFNKDFSFGATALSPIANSTFLAKYDASGAKLWAVSFAGAATPSAITTADNGDVYVAGRLADVVVFGSTDNVTKVADGVKDGGDYVSYQSAAFIAQYSAAGVLLKVETYKPEMLEGMFFPDYSRDAIRLNILSIKKIADKLVASILVGGIYSNNGLVLEGSKYLIDGFPLDVQAGYVVSFDNNLALSGIFGSLMPKADLAINYDVKESQFDVVDNTVYAGFMGMGSQVLTVGNTTIPVEFTVVPNAEENLLARGFVVAEIDFTTGSLVKNVLFENTAISGTAAYLTTLSLNAMKKVGDELVITGSFGKELPFDNAVIASDNADVYVVSLDPSTLAVKSSVSSAKAGKEIATSTAILDRNVYVGSDIDKNASLYTINLDTKVASSQDFASTYLNALASIGNDKLVSVSTPINGTDGKLLVKVDKVENGLGIGGNTADDVLSVYPNPVVDVLHFNELVNVEVYSIAGSLVLAANNVDELNVQSLVKGAYIVKVKTNAVSKVVTVIKK